MRERSASVAAGEQVGAWWFTQSCAQIEADVRGLGAVLAVEFSPADRCRPMLGVAAIAMPIDGNAGAPGRCTRPGRGCAA